MFYYKLNQAIASTADTITKIKAFLADARLGWAESAYTTGDNTQALLKTGASHLGSYGYVHIIKVDGTPNLLNIHAYPPGYGAFISPATFDAPDTAFFPGGGSYSEATEYFSSTGTAEHRIDFTTPAVMDLFGDTRSLFIYLSTGVYPFGGMVICPDRTLDFGYVQFVMGGVRFSLRNGVANIDKNGSNGGYICPGHGTSFGAANGGNIGDQVLNASPSTVLYQVYFWAGRTLFKEIFKMPNLFLTLKGVTRGTELTYGGYTYYCPMYGGGATGVYASPMLLKETELT